MNAGTPPLVSVIVPHRGSDTTLKHCIRSLRAQSLAPQDLEIVIVINEPAKRAVDIDLAPNEKVLFATHGFSYGARNRGIEASRGSIIAMTDSDTVADPQWLEEAVRLIHAGHDMVGGHIELTFLYKPLSPSACYEKLYAFDQEKNIRFGRAATANLVARRSAFDRFGLFDESVQSGEDFAWTTRATKQGATLVYAPRAVVSHPARETLSELLQKAQRVTSGHSEALVGLEKIRQGYRRYVSLYLVPPSRSRRHQCSFRELVLAYLMSVVVQLAKLWFFAPGLVKRTKTPI